MRCAQCAQTRPRSRALAPPSGSSCSMPVAEPMPRPEPRAPCCRAHARATAVQGCALLAAQFGAQAAKRAVSTLRDRRTLFWQLVVPVLLVATSQATNRAAFRLDTPPLVISRRAPGWMAVPWVCVSLCPWAV